MTGFNTSTDLVNTAKLKLKSGAAVTYAMTFYADDEQTEPLDTDNWTLALEPVGADELNLDGVTAVAQDGDPNVLLNFSEAFTRDAPPFVTLDLALVAPNGLRQQAYQVRLQLEIGEVIYA